MNYQDQILTLLFHADIVKTAAAKRNNILKAVHMLKALRRILQRENKHQWLEKMREWIEAAALRANIPSDLEGRISKPEVPKAPKREYVYRPAINHAVWRVYNPDKIPSDLE